MSNSTPYNENDFIFFVITCIFEPSYYGPSADSAMRAAFALFCHYFKADNNLVVSGGRERPRNVPDVPGNRLERGIRKPDLLVECRGPRHNSISDLIFCAVRKANTREAYVETLDEILDSSGNPLLTGDNKNVFVCVMRGAKISFFKRYYTVTPERNYKGLVPMYPTSDGFSKYAIGVTIQGPFDYVIGCELDTLEEKCFPYVHDLFLQISRSGGPIDPEVYW